jgi:hypothetical protein
MMHRRERLDDKQLRHAHAARYGDAANIVTHQIDDHQVFGAVFRRGASFSACCDRPRDRQDAAACL